MKNWHRWLIAPAVASGIIGLGSSGFIAAQTRAQSRVQSRAETPAFMEKRAAQPVAPELRGTGWLNTPGQKPVSLASRRGKVTVVQFWTFACSNCRANLPIYARLQRKFAAQDVEIIGVHTPELDFERDPKNVAAQVKQLGITYPVLLDPQSENWRRWNQRYWPTLYVLDKSGVVRGKWEGELNYGGANGEAQVAKSIEKLLAEPSGT